MSTRRALVCIFLSFTLTANPAWAWGVAAHRIIARIAAARIVDEAVRAKILAVLDLEANAECTQTDLGDRLACVSTWADDVKRTTKTFTRNWHFVDIPKDAKSYDAARDCRQKSGGDCITNAIARQRDLLVNPSDSTTPPAKAEAVKFLVHLVGDITQPLHCTDDHDRGGNGKIVTWFGEADSPYGHWNLHEVWDDGMVYRSNRPREDMKASSWSVDVAYAKLLLKDGDIEPSGAFSAGKLAAWALEDHDVAVEHAYATLPPPRQGQMDGPEHTDKMYYVLGADYESVNLAAMELQLRRAGQRLADLLSDIFVQPR